jgi:hypothetical protein
MAFGYEFVDLTDEQKLQRRSLLDLHAFYAQISFLVVFATVAGLRWIAHVLNRGVGAAEEEESGFDSPSSAELKYAEQSRVSSEVAKARLKLRQWLWRAGDPVREGWGSWGEWIAGTIWSVWILFLCMNQTGHGKFQRFSLP